MVPDPSPLQHVAVQLRQVLTQTDPVITLSETVAQAIGEAYEMLDAVAQGSQDAELCLVVGVRGEVGALEWIDDERFVPANGANPEWATYCTVYLHDNSMPPHTELRLADVLAAAEEYVRIGRRPTCVDWTFEAAWL